MKKTLAALFAILCITGLVSAQKTENKPRVIVMTDGEIDDRNSMVRFLMYLNDVDLAAIIETNSVYQREGHSSEDWLEKQLEAYEQVYPNLHKHDPDYPDADEIRSKSWVGDEDPDHLVVDRNSPGRKPGSEVVINPANWPDTPGSDRIVEILLEDDSRPVYLQAWGGGNTAARAFHKLKTDYPGDYERAISKVRMYNIWYQDGAGSYIEKYHPGVCMLLNHYFDGSWNYHSQSYTYELIKNEVKTGHGPLGALYPQDYVSEGDSPAFLWALDNGLRNHEDPSYGGWGGRYYKVEGYQNLYADYSEGSYTRWIEDANRDFQARMDWCVAESFADANHKPIIRIKGGLDRTVNSGDEVILDASGSSEPDNEKMYFRWWQYHEAGTYPGMIRIDRDRADHISFKAPDVDETQSIHLILEVSDRGKPRLTAFQRMIITVNPR